jgi:hypothetical protein
MFRMSVVLVGFVAVLGVAANLNASFIDNFDTGYTTDDQALNSPWVSGGGSIPIMARNKPAWALSDGWCLAQDGNGVERGHASRPTGATTTETNISASVGLSVNAGSAGNWGVLALSTSPVVSSNAWYATPGTISVQWEPDWAIEVGTIDGNGTGHYTDFTPTGFNTTTG